MPYSQRTISRRTRILFPIVVTVLVGTLVPFATPLIGMLMLGNLMKESGAVERLTKASSQEIANVVTLFLGLAIGSTMVGVEFLKPSTLAILVLGILAFAFDTAAGLLFAQGSQRRSAAARFNPLIGAAGISAFPMAARVVQQGRAGGGLRELPADARDGRQRRRPGGERRRRRRAAGADGGRIEGPPLDGSA